MSRLKPYEKYNSVNYDYVSQLPIGWELLPNIAIFQERKEKGGIKMETLSVSAIKGIVKASDYDDRKDRTSDDKSEYLIVHEGDIPYNTMLMWAGAVGRSEYKGIVSPAYTVLQPKSKVKINTKYFHYMFRSQYYKNYSKRFSYGIVDSRLRLYYTYFKRMYSIVPPLETQNAIVNYLDRKTQQIQEFIQKKERLIELLEEKLNKFIYSVLIEGTLDKQTTQNTNSFLQPNAPLSWQRYRLKHLCSKPITGQWGEDAKGDKNDIICIRVADYKNLGLSDEGHTIRNINKSDRLQLKNNDLLIEKSGGGEKTPVGRVVKFDLPINAVTSNFISKFSALTEIITPDYLLQIFNCLNIVRYNVRSIKQTTGIQNLDIDHFFSNKLYIPSIERQKELLLEINNLKTKTEFLTQKAFSEIELAKEYQESLITQVVSGQLKVPEKAYPNVHYKEFDMVAEQGSSYHT